MYKVFFSGIYRSAGMVVGLFLRSDDETLDSCFIIYAG